MVYIKERMKPIACLFMKQNCHFDRGLAQYKHASLPMSFLGINTTLLGHMTNCTKNNFKKRIKLTMTTGPIQVK